MAEFILGIIVIASLVFGYFAARRLGRFLEEKDRDAYRQQPPQGNRETSRRGSKSDEIGAAREPMRRQPAGGHSARPFR